MSDQEKKQQRNNDMLNAETKPTFFLSTLYKAKKKIPKNCFLRKGRVDDWTLNENKPL